MVLNASGLTKSYGERTVVRDVALSLHPGSVLGLLGPNGAGKSTTVGMLYGAVVPNSGRVEIRGYDLATNPRQARARLGVVRQDNDLDPDFNAYSILLLFARYYGITGARARERATALLERVGLTAHAKKFAETLSGGMQRKLILARALISDPEILFLDEPTTGLDPDARQDFWKLISDLKREGKAVLLTTHYMDEAERLCDNLLLMQEGAVVDGGSPRELIARIIGSESAELEGVELQSIREIAENRGSWAAPLGAGVLVPLGARAEELWNALEQTNPSRITRRRANLDDVFLRLTGGRLA